MYDTLQSEITGVCCVLNHLIERWNAEGKGLLYLKKKKEKPVILLENKQSVIKT